MMFAKRKRLPIVAKMVPKCNICGNDNRELHWSSAGRISGLRVSFDLTTSIGRLNWECDNLTAKSIGFQFSQS